MCDPIRIEAGGLDRMPVFVELLERAGAALWARGIHQWAAGDSRRQLSQLVEQAESGLLLMASVAGQEIGGCILTRIADPFWPDAPSDAVYLHKLVVVPERAGEAIGVRILERAEAWASTEGYRRIRLDCWDQNHRLRGYYRERGFAERAAAVELTYAVRMFEKVLGDSARSSGRAGRVIGREGA